MAECVYDCRPACEATQGDGPAIPHQLCPTTECYKRFRPMPMPTRAAMHRNGGVAARRQADGGVRGSLEEAARERVQRRASTSHNTQRCAVEGVAKE